LRPFGPAGIWGRGVTPVVLVPGLLCDDRIWAPVRERLHTSTIVVDLTSASTMDEMARQILAAAPARFVLAGFSMGGMAAMASLPNAGDRLAGVVLIATHAGSDTPERKAMRLRQIERAFAGGFDTLVTEELKPAYFSHRDDVETRAFRRLTLQMAQAQGPVIFRRHALALMGRPDLAAASAGFGGPVEVIAGEHDRLVDPAASRALARQGAHRRFTLLPGCGHMAPLERPDAIADALERVAA